MLSLTSSRHLFWKEYRTQRALWFLVLLLAAVYGMLLLLWGVLSGASGGIPVGVVYFTLLAFPPVYAWGCGALLFAGEHDQETHDFLRAQPVSANQVYWVKLLTILSGTLLLVPAVSLLGFLLTGGRVPTEQPYLGQMSLHWSLWTNTGVTSFELLSWSILFSLLLRRILPALLLSAALAMALGICATVISEWGAAWPTARDERFLLSQPVRLLASILVLAATARLGIGWFRAAEDSGPRRWETNTPRTVVSCWRRLRILPDPRPLGHLIWHARRQAGAVYLGSLLFVFFSSLLVLSGTTGPKQLGGATIFWCALIPLSGWAGLLSFLPDQASRRYAYFAERGVHPGDVWLSRLLVAAFLPAVWIILAMAITLLSHFWFAMSPVYQPSRAGDDLLTSQNVVRMLWASLLLFSVGQAVSLYSRSPVVGMATGLFSGLFFAYVFLVLHVLRVPGTISALPLSVALLLATRRSMRAWVEQIQHWRERCRKAAWIVLPLLLVAVTICTYRVVEIPYPAPLGTEVLRRGPTDEEATTARMYAKVFQHFRGYPIVDVRPRSPGNWSLPPAIGPSDVVTDREILELFVEASRRDAAWFPPRHDWTGTTRIAAMEVDHLREVSAILAPLNQLVTRRLNERLEAGQLDAALEYPLALLRFAQHLVPYADAMRVWEVNHLESTGADLLARWASREGQTAEIVRQALSRINHDHGDAIWKEWDVNQWIRRECLWWQDVLEERPAHQDGQDLAFLRTLRRYAPWEIARMRRVLNFVLLADWYSGEVDLARRWVNSTPYMRDMIFLEYLEDIEYNQQAPRRLRQAILHLQLAIRAYQLEHGHYPKTLMDLPEDDRRRFPADVLVGDQSASIIYVPDGVDQPLEFTGNDPLATVWQIPAGHPLLWVRGRGHVHFESFLTAPQDPGQLYYPVP